MCSRQYHSNYFLILNTPTGDKAARYSVQRLSIAIKPAPQQTNNSRSVPHWAFLFLFYLFFIIRVLCQVQGECVFSVYKVSCAADENIIAAIFVFLKSCVSCLTKIIVDSEIMLSCITGNN